MYFLNWKRQLDFLMKNDNRIVLETGTGTTGKFIVGETITGATSGATAEVLVDDLGNTTKPRLFITSQQQFITGETITGGTSVRLAQLLVIAQVLFRIFNNFLRMQMLTIQYLIFLRSSVSRL